jgi:hypothetical protein
MSMFIKKSIQLNKYSKKKILSTSQMSICGSDFKYGKKLILVE